MPAAGKQGPPLANALSRRRMRELFATNVVPVLFPGHTLTNLALQFSSYKAGKEHVGVYRLDLDPPPEGGAPVATATFGRPQRIQRAYNLTSANRTGASPAALLLPKQSCLIQVFPSDPELPLLWHAADASRATGLLAPLLADHGPLSVRRVGVLRYRPESRCVLLCDIECSNGKGLQLVVKLYSDASRAIAVRNKLSALSDQQTNALKLPALVADAGDKPLLLMTSVQGKNLGDQIEQHTSRPDNERSIRAAAAALASFHNFTLQSSQRRTLRTELDNIRHRIEPTYAVAPALAKDIEVLLTQIDTRVAQLPPTADCVIHGEYKPNQLLIDGDQIAVVDLDRTCLGDPAIDVGNFIGVLSKEVLFEGHSHLAGLDEVFVSEYLAANRVEGIVERAGLFKTIALLRILTRYFERAPRLYARQGEDWPPLVLLHEARRSLEAL